MKKFKDIVAQLFRFYDFSAVRTAGLKDIQSVLGAPDLKLKKPVIPDGCLMIKP